MHIDGCFHKNCNYWNVEQVLANYMRLIVVFYSSAFFQSVLSLNTLRVNHRSINMVIKGKSYLESVTDHKHILEIYVSVWHVLKIEIDIFWKEHNRIHASLIRLSDAKESLNLLLKVDSYSFNAESGYNPLLLLWMYESVLSLWHRYPFVSHYKKPCGQFQHYSYGKVFQTTDYLSISA